MRPFYLVISAVCAVASIFTGMGCDPGTTIIQVPRDSVGHTEKLRLVLRLVDARTNQPLHGAEASVDGRQGTADADGIVRFDSLDAGETFVQARLAGYATQIGTVQVGAQGTGAIALHRIGSSVAGKIFLQPANRDSSLTIPPPTEVHLRLLGDFAEAYKSVRTGADGTFRFDSLPEQAAFIFEPIALESAGARYAAYPGAVPSTTPAAGDIGYLQSFILAPMSKENPILLSPREMNVDPHAAVAIRFSAAIDTTALIPNAILVFPSYFPLYGFPRQIAVVHSWNAARTLLSVEPFDGVWPSDSTVTIQLQGFMDSAGDSLEGTGSAVIRVTPTPHPETSHGGNPPKPVDSVWVASSFYGGIGEVSVDNKDTTLTVNWTPVAGATDYEIYYRSSSDSLWSLQQTSVGSQAIVSTNRLSKGPVRYEFMVIPGNADGRGSFSEAKPLILSDKTRPQVSTYSSAYRVMQQYANNPDGTTDIVSVYEIRLASLSGGQLEPLDTTRSPQVAVRNWNGDIDTGSTFENFHWTSQNTARIQVRRDLSEPWYNGWLQINFQILMDLSGNFIAPVNGYMGVSLLIY